MALVRWNPVNELDAFQSDLNRLFDGFFGAARTGSGAQRWVPATDLVETEGHYVLRADLPGMSEDDVNIEVQDNVLTISGERRSESEQEHEGYQRVERAFGRFTRSLSLPSGIDADRIEASFDNGVLEVRVPKPEERKPHRVEIAKGSVEGKGEEK